MAYFDTTWYVNFGDGSTTGYFAVAKRPQNTAVTIGQIVRQFTTPAVGSERVFICTGSGTTANTTDATWTITRGGHTTDGTAGWRECSGVSSINGDLTNTPSWATMKAAGTPTTGVIIKRNSGASYQLCFTTGTLGASEPAFSDTAGVQVTESGGSAQWQSLGPVGNFTGGQAPHARLNNVFGTNWFASGNTVYVGNNHAETQGSLINMFPTSTLLAKILCHNHSGSYPPAAGDLTTGATITTTGSFNLNFSLIGSVYVYGIAFSCATSGAQVLTINTATSLAVHNWHYYDNCSFALGTTTGSAYVQVGPTVAASWSTTIFDNCKLKFLDIGQTLATGFSQFMWRNTGRVLLAGSTVPSILLKNTISSTGYPSTVTLEGLDLSQLTSSLFSNVAGSSIGSLTIKDCKLNASATVTTPVNTGMTVQLARSAADATSYKSSRHTYEAVETTETSIVRTGGFTDPAGQVQSRKIVTTANSQWLRPYAAQPMAVWNADVGAPKTVTVYGTVNTGALPTNDEVWLEVSYLGSSSFPVGSVATSGKANVWSAGSAGVSDSSNWAAPVYATWDLVDKSQATLSNGNLTATSANTGYARSTSIQISGKYYWEITLSTWANGNTGPYFGIATGQVPTTGIAGLSKDGNLWVSFSSVFLGAVGSGSSIGIAVDITAKLIWFRILPSGNWNASGTANPATGVGGRDITSLSGTLKPGVALSGVGEVATVNFGASAFSGTVPSGFTSGWTDLWSPFKLVATLTPQMPGYLIPQVKVAKASTTVYIDPLAVVT